MSLGWSLIILGAATAATIGAMLLVRRRAPDGSYFAGFIIFLAFHEL